MSKIEALAGQLIVVKFAYLTRPCSAKVAAVEKDGLWLEDGELILAVEKSVLETGQFAGAPSGMEFRQRFPLLFLPFSQVQWLAAAKP